MNKKELVLRFRPLVSLACRVHNLRNVFRIRGRGKGNRVEAPCALLNRVKIAFSGCNNTVIVEDFSTLKGVSVYIHGNDNVVHIGKWCHLVQTEFSISQSGNAITIGEHTKIMGKTELAAIEGTKITIGNDCLFSSEIHFRTGDSHSMLDLSGRRINPSQDIVIGDHVWIGTRVTCLKGAVVPPHSVVGACALVTGSFAKANCVLAGVPARVVKEGVDWCIQRIPMEETAPVN